MRQNTLTLEPLLLRESVMILYMSSEILPSKSLSFIFLTSPKLFISRQVNKYWLDLRLFLIVTMTTRLCQLDWQYPWIVSLGDGQNTIFTMCHCTTVPPTCLAVLHVLAELLCCLLNFLFHFKLLLDLTFQHVCLAGILYTMGAA